MPKKKEQYHVLDGNGVVQPGGPYPNKKAAEAAIAKRLASDERVGAPAEAAAREFYAVAYGG